MKYWITTCLLLILFISASPLCYGQYSQLMIDNNTTSTIMNFKCNGYDLNIPKGHPAKIPWGGLKIAFGGKTIGTCKCICLTEHEMDVHIALKADASEGKITYVQKFNPHFNETFKKGQIGQMDKEIEISFSEK